LLPGDGGSHSHSSSQATTALPRTPPLRRRLLSLGLILPGGGLDLSHLSSHATAVIPRSSSLASASLPGNIGSLRRLLSQLRVLVAGVSLLSLILVI
ncbi:hypothetical protein LINGRAHAP2_LOCUS31215, partial [Linum grandiflorum]